jgi:hypothetical protein
VTRRDEIAPGLKRLSQAPRREDYEQIVKGLRPATDGEELILRSSLLLMRDQAMATKSHACEPAWLLLDIVERQASDIALHHKVSLDDLREIRRLCVSCVMAANGFDMLYQPRLPLSEGEANGRG